METLVSETGMVVSPHRAATRAGEEVLAAGGSAIEAMIAAAATIAVVYPHMNAIGGDGFWLIAEPGRAPLAILAAGRAGSGAHHDRYGKLGHDVMPTRGPLAAATTAGTVAGWAMAHEISAATTRRRLPPADLLAAAVRHAREGIVVPANFARDVAAKRGELADVPGFAATFMPGGEPPKAGSKLVFERLADTLEHLGRAGFEDFYRGDVGAALASDLERLGSPVTRADLEATRAVTAAPLSVRLRQATLYNTPLPTQGFASLIILGLFERLGVTRAESFEHVHGLVEATKQAFLLREKVWTDPLHAPADVAAALEPAALERMAERIDRRRAAPWPAKANPGDTVWLGAIDRTGLAVSFIQSIYFEFGSGCVLPQTGVLWQNRASAFSLDPRHRAPLLPGRLPPHTLNPALARLDNGRVLVYGTMGGEGQPQTQAAVLTRHLDYGMDAGAAIAAPRWLLGRTWGAESVSLKLEPRFDPDLVAALERAGHEIEMLPDAYSDTVGHAGLITRRPDGRMEGAHDPRGDGASEEG
ncbi:gamma-glutamyltransferase [Pseudoxanthobacter sp. M-2]|uniref:gamma-glutamyltransferase family protein n=1 Tax=Pseudoxanthobacter sp. M-2 TaxID=3078754 RepID=UPI0038FCD368